MADTSAVHREAVDGFVDRVAEAELPSVNRLVLFGSVARATHSPESDVDVLAILADSADERRVEERLRDVAYDVMLDHGIPISVHAVTESTLERRSNHPFFRDVFDEGEAIYG